MLTSKRDKQRFDNKMLRWRFGSIRGAVMFSCKQIGSEIQTSQRFATFLIPAPDIIDAVQAFEKAAKDLDKVCMRYMHMTDEELNTLRAQIDLQKHEVK